jgi:hypothetical protein
VPVSASPNKINDNILQTAVNHPFNKIEALRYNLINANLLSKKNQSSSYTQKNFYDDQVRQEMEHYFQPYSTHFSVQKNQPASLLGYALA